MAKYLHLQICLNSDLVKKNCEWYKYEPSPVLENENFKILWDFSIQTDKEIRANRPDIIFVDKRERTVMFIDVTIPNDHNIIEKKLEKIEKYTDLGIEIKELWNMQRVDIVPIVIGCTGVVDNSFLIRSVSNDENTVCRMCKRGQESVKHVLSNCESLVKYDFILRHDSAFKCIVQGRI